MKKKKKYKYIYIYIHTHQKQESNKRLERTREHHQKLQLYKHHNGNKFISFSTLNVNGLNTPIKRHRVIMDKKTRSIYMLFTRDPL